jgi:hypothetical protein
MRFVLKVLAVLFVAVVGIASFNYQRVYRPVSMAWATDTRNNDVEIWPHLDFLVLPSTLVLDFRGMAGSKARVDVMRMVMQAAVALRDTEFNQVKLSYRGQVRFLLDGSDFKELGTEFARGQNPVFLINNFPEKLKNADGTRAFSKWTGGWLGVARAQIDDFNSFNDRWYLNDLLAKPLR